MIHFPHRDFFSFVSKNWICFSGDRGQSVFFSRLCVQRAFLIWPFPKLCSKSPISSFLIFLRDPFLLLSFAPPLGLISASSSPPIYLRGALMESGRKRSLRGFHQIVNGVFEARVLGRKSTRGDLIFLLAQIGARGLTIMWFALGSAWKRCCWAERLSGEV